MTLQISLFDSLRVTTDNGAPIRSLRPRAQRLLAFLLLRRDRPLPREQVAFTLWADSTEQEALGTLRRALSDLRVTLPAMPKDEWIAVSEGSLRWNPDASWWLDVDAFESLISQSTSIALHDAVALSTGELLTAWDDEWLLAERERLRHMRVGALRTLVGHHRALGELDTALALARQTLDLDPWSEAGHRDLIALHYQSGDRAAALATYDRLATLLRDELGVEPMTETLALRDLIMQGATLPLLPETIGPATTLTRRAQQDTAADLPRLIGRQTEMHQLSALWDSAAAGDGRLAIVSGEAGVGKSHLLASLSNEVTRRGGLVLRGHCYEFEQALPYQPIVEMLRSASRWLRHTDLEPAHRVALARLAPDVLGVVGVPDPTFGSHRYDLRTQMFEAMLQAFLSLARGRALLLLIEDVHWGDASTLDWLAYSAPRLGAARILLAITYRIDEVGTEHALVRLRSRLARDASVVPLELEPLTRESHRELVAHLSGLPDVLAISDQLYEETAGNPFFLREVVHGLIEAGQISVHMGRWVGAFVEGTPVANLPLPDSLRETISARVGRLTERTRMFLQMAGIAGRVFNYQIVRQAGGWTEEHALAALEDALTRGFIRQGNGHEDYAFGHHLVQETIYADLTLPRRIYWHRRMADTLAQAARRQAPAQRRAMAGHITHHALHGEYPELVFDWAPLAAEHAYDLYAYADALTALEAASHAVGRLRSDPTCDLAVVERQHIDVLLNRAALIPHVGRPHEEYGQIIHEAADLLTRHPDERQRATFFLRESDYLTVLSRFEDAIDATLNAYELFLAQDDQRGAASALYHAGNYMITISRNRDGRRLLERALAVYQDVGDITGEVQCLSGLAWSGLNLGEVEYALQHLNRSLELSEQRADRHGMARTCYVLAAAWCFYHHPERVQEFAEKSMHLYREVGYAATSYRPMLYLAEAHRICGHLDSARQLLKQSFDMASTYHDSWLAGWTSQQLGRLALASGDLPEAELRLRGAYELRLQSGEIQNQISDLTWLGRLRLAQGRPETAREHTTQAILQLESLWGEFYVWEMPDVFMAHAETVAATGDATGAATYLQRAHDTLMRFAAQIRDASILEGYLAYPLNARLVAAWETRQIQPL